MKIFQNSILTIIFRLILGSLFIYAAIEKIIDPFGFAADIRNYEIFPTIFSNSLAIYLPWIELYCGIFLLIGVFSRSSASIIAVLLVGFMFAIIAAMIKGLDIECGCYRTIWLASKVGFRKFIENLILFGLAIQIIKSKSSSISIDKILKS